MGEAAEAVTMAAGAADILNLIRWVVVAVAQDTSALPS